MPLEAAVARAISHRACPSERADDLVVDVDGGTRVLTHLDERAECDVDGVEERVDRLDDVARLRVRAELADTLLAEQPDA